MRGGHFSDSIQTLAAKIFAGTPVIELHDALTMGTQAAGSPSLNPEKAVGSNRRKQRERRQSHYAGNTLREAFPLQVKSDGKSRRLYLLDPQFTPLAPV